MNYYAEVIEAVSQEQDWKRIVLVIAKRHPKIIVNAIESISWKPVAKKLMKDGQKVEAIKLCRQITGMGLKESKDAVEEL